MRYIVIKVLIYIFPLILLYILLCIRITKNEASRITKRDESYNGTGFIPAGNNKKDWYMRERTPLRKRPPNASFFSRVDGVEKSSEGLYEEQYLGVVESIRWKKRLLKKQCQKIKLL